MGERLGTNRGFELNDVTQFTISTVTSFGAGTTNVVHDGTYGALIRNGGTSNNWDGARKTFTTVLTTQAVVCGAGAQVTASFWQRIYQDTLPPDGRWGTRTMALVVDFYNASDGLISSEAVTTGFPTSTYGQKTGTVTAPAGTAYCKLKVTYAIQYYVVEPADGATFNHYIAIDDFSITIPASAPQIIWNV